jgi:hypothetical protein
VVAEPEEKARAKRACSRAATARSKLSLELSERKWHAGKVLGVPIGVRASCVFVGAYWLANACLCKGCGEGDLTQGQDN